MREVVELTEAQLAALDAWRVARGMSRAEAIEQAVKGLLESSTRDSQPPAEHAQLDEDHLRERLSVHPVVDAAFGLWKTRTLDGLAEQERLRSEWDAR
jgi:hypothetical protein